MAEKFFSPSHLHWTISTKENNLEKPSQHLHNFNANATSFTHHIIYLCHRISIILVGMGFILF